MIIREYEKRDWLRLIEIHDSARKIELELAGHPDAFIPLVQAAEKEGLFDYTICVAELDGVVQGFAAYSDDELAWLYVDPAYMGQGIGKKLIKHVMDNIKTRPLYVEVLAGNKPAIGLYESMGFHTEEMLTGAMPGNESFQVTVHSMLLK